MCRLKPCYLCKLFPFLFRPSFSVLRHVLSSPGWPHTHVSASSVLGFQVYTTYGYEKCLSVLFQAFFLPVWQFTHCLLIPSLPNLSLRTLMPLCIVLIKTQQTVTYPGKCCKGTAMENPSEGGQELPPRRRGLSAKA